jgi:hypothetical protein
MCCASSACSLQCFGVLTMMRWANGFFAGCSEKAVYIRFLQPVIFRIHIATLATEKRHGQPFDFA